MGIPRAELGICGGGELTRNGGPRGPGSSQQLKASQVAVAFPVVCGILSDFSLPLVPRAGRHRKVGWGEAGWRVGIGILSAFPFSLQLQILPTPQF